MRSPLRAMLVNDASLAGHHGSSIVTAQIVALAADAGIKVEHGWDWGAVEKALAVPGSQFDLVLINGEGSIRDDSRAARRIAVIAERASSRGWPAYLVNASEEGNSKQVMDGLRACRLRFVRDSASQASLERAGLSSKVIPDLTLSWAGAPKARPAGSTLLVTDASDSKKSTRILRMAARWSAAQTVSFRTRPPWPARGDRSRRIGFEIKRVVAALAPRSEWSERHAGSRSQDALLRLWASAQGVVCARYHAVCLALRTGLPFVAVEGNIGKVSGLLSDIRLMPRLTTLETLEAQGSAPQVMPFSPEEQERISAFLTEAERSAKEMFAAIADDARTVARH